MTLTRRALLERIGSAGGLGAAYMAMETLGLAIPTPAGAEKFSLPRAQRRRTFGGDPRRGHRRLGFRL